MQPRSSSVAPASSPLLDPVPTTACPATAGAARCPNATGQRRTRRGRPSAAGAAAAAEAPACGPAACGSTPGAAGADGLPAGLSALFPGGEFSVQMQVRDYELDQYGVVNNAVYASYLQHARHEALSALGADADAFARRGTPLALSSLGIAFRAPLRSRDSFRVTVSTARVTPARLVLQQRILKARGGAAEAAGHAAAAAEAAGEELVAEAEAVVVFLDSNYRPSRVPADIARLFKSLQELREAHAQR